MTLGALRLQLKSLDSRLGDLEGEVKQQTDILTTLALPGRTSRWVGHALQLPYRPLGKEFGMPFVMP